MAKERFERRAYRRSPGRQYGYDYDPLGSQKRSGSSQSGRVDSSLTGEQWPSRGNATSQNLGRSSGPLAPRPDPRRTRQLLRQNILASKTHSTTLPEEETEEQEEVVQPLQTRHVEEENELEQYGYEEEQQDDSTLFRNRYPARNRKVGQVPPNRRIEPAPYEPMSEEYVEADRQEGDWDEFEPVDPDLGYEDPLDQRVGYAQSPQSPQARQARQAPVTTSRRLPPSRRSYEEQYDEEDYADEEDEEPARRKAKKGGLSRRKLLVGLGLAATVTGDFLNVTLQAVMSARGFLVKFNQDNSTLAALQTVLATWVKQVNEVPKEIQTITDADLDGAQAYLRALQRKIQDETNKLNNPQATPTTPKATPTPKH